MVATVFLVALSALIHQAASQTGVELDEPMLRGGRPTGPQAMLRFGCSQLVIERLDPFVSIFQQSERIANICPTYS